MPTIYRSGTPSKVAAGRWFDTFHNPEYKSFDGDAYDNPISTKEETKEWIENECKSRGVELDDASIQTEFFWQVGCHSD